LRIILTLLLLFSLAIPVNAGKSILSEALRSVGHVTRVDVDDEGNLWETGCSAFAIDTRKFMTAAHCIADKLKIDGHAAFPVKIDEKVDLAVLVTDFTLSPLTFRQRPLALEEQVMGLGYGYSWKFPTPTKHEVIILKYSPFPDIYPGTWFLNGFIGGMSGGPIIDKDGQVVGIVQRSNSRNGYGVDVETILEFLNEK
jgi:hypothetical protein